jgi:hypothetical protein
MSEFARFGPSRWSEVLSICDGFSRDWQFLKNEGAYREEVLPALHLHSWAVGFLEQFDCGRPKSAEDIEQMNFISGWCNEYVEVVRKFSASQEEPSVPKQFREDFLRLEEVLRTYDAEADEEDEDEDEDDEDEDVE